MKTFLCSHLVTISWNGREAYANLERISQTLATINAEDPVPVGTPVAISTPGHELKGTVVNCTIEMSGHEIDVALEPAWSQEEFTPDHLFDPDVMIAP